MSAGAASNLEGREVSKESQGQENRECAFWREARGSWKAGIPFLVVLMGNTGMRDTGDEGGAAATQQLKA